MAQGIAHPVITNNDTNALSWYTAHVDSVLSKSEASTPTPALAFNLTDADDFLDLGPEIDAAIGAMNLDQEEQLNPADDPNNHPIGLGLSL